MIYKDGFAGRMMIILETVSYKMRPENSKELTWVADQNRHGDPPWARDGRYSEIGGDKVMLGEKHYR